MTSPPDDTTTDLHAVIAALRAERDAGLAREATLAEALARRNSEFGERIEQQAATVDVLKIMSTSPGDVRPVFELIVERARSFCGADHATAALLQDDMLHLQAYNGMSAAYGADYAAQFPRPVDTSTMFGRAIQSRDVIQSGNLRSERDYFARQIHTVLDIHSTVAVPILREGTPIGAIALARNASGDFSDSQIELLKTFAEQAVIAITSAETYRALQTRTSDLQETLEYQTATSDVLKVISRSTFDLQPVLETVVKTATQLCNAEMTLIGRRDGERWRVAANYGFPPEYEAYERAHGAMAINPNSPSVGWRAVREQHVVHIHDVAAIPDYHEASIRLAKQRTSLGVPLVRDGEAIGVIMLARRRVEPFTDRQIDLVSTFADQAVIAIENTRLLTEQREALEQQTATAEVLQVINASPGNLVPVFDAMLEKAMRLCGGTIGGIFTFDGDHSVTSAVRGVTAAFQEYNDKYPMDKIQPGTLPARIIETRGPVQNPDVTAGENYRAGHPYARELVELGGIRAVLAVPLLKDGVAVGMVAIYRQETGAFTDKQIALLQNFAAQAVIAIENARLLTEQQEALEQQTATAEVLQVINANPGNLAPAFDAILDKAHTLCGAAIGSLVLFDGTYFRAVATHGWPNSITALFSEPAGPNRARQRLMDGERFVQVADIRAIGRGPNSAWGDAVVESTDARTMLLVPLRKEGALLGFISAFRPEVRAFSDKEIALLENFAAQAVIAMENARLLTEQREALEQQTATAEVLQVINSSPGDLAPVFEAMLDKAIRLCEAAHGHLLTYDGECFHLAAASREPHYVEWARQVGAVRPGPSAPLGRISRGERIVHIADLREEEVYRTSPAFREQADIRGARSQITVGLFKDNTLLGAMIVYRQEVRPFSDKQIALLENFAAQAVIAMENARLITEQREALEQQTATAEVLQVINASPGNLPPVFNAMLEKAMRLCGAQFGQLVTTADGQVFTVAAAQGPTAIVGFLRNRPPTRPGPGTSMHRLIQGERRVHIPDVTSDEAYQRGDTTRRALVDLGGCRTLLTVGLRKEDALLGAITVYRQEMRLFSEKEIALLENFAAQAVIAMENARLITEQREALEQQTATAEVLQVINASPGDLQPVFDAILDKAHRLCNAPMGSLVLYDGEHFRALATHGFPPQYAALIRQPFHPSRRHQRLLRGERFIHVPDIRAIGVSDHEVFRNLVQNTGARTLLTVPLRKDGSLLGTITAYRLEVRPYSDKEIALLENFAAQAVIAMENARLLTELRQRTEELVRRNSEYGERIEQQTATINVLEAMSASSGDAQPVFQVIVERARAFCNADNANLALVEDDMLHLQATTIGSNASATTAAHRAGYMAQFPRPVDTTSLFGRAVLARDAVQTPDVWVDPQHFTSALSGEATVRALVAVPLVRAGMPIGAIVLARNTPGEFSATQVELLRTFAEQAVIAISSAETFKELQHRTADLTRSVAELQALEEVLRAVNSSLELETVLSTVISRAVQLSDADEGTIYEFDDAEQVFVPKSAYGMTEERVTVLRNRRIRIGETPLGNSAAMRAPLHISDLTQTLDIEGSRALVEDGIHALLAVPLLRDEKVLGGLVIRRRAVGGFAPTVPTLLQTFAGQCVLAIENARLFQDARRARIEAETTLADLRRTQDRLVQSEKMASLGQLTAGIAHEIKNPLNFVNNFAALSVDLLGELKETAAPGFATLTDKERAEVEEVSAMLTSNLEKITEHGKRADGIVKAMLEHSRGSSGERRMVDLNALIDEALNLAYHGARAQDQSFNVTLERDFGEGISPIEVNPQDITRVFLNIFANGFYAATRRARDGGDAGFVPTLKVTTRDAGEAVEIRVRDNGTGIPADIRDKLFQPFFTTKPTGEGTGLGLSITYDIVTQQHGGSIAVDSKVSEYSEFTIRLPRNP